MRICLELVWAIHRSVTWLKSDFPSVTINSLCVFENLVVRPIPSNCQTFSGPDLAVDVVACISVEITNVLVMIGAKATTVIRPAPRTDKTDFRRQQTHVDDVGTALDRSVRRMMSHLKLVAMSIRAQYG